MKTPGPLRFAGLGIQLAVTIVAGVFGGQWLDRKLGTGGIFAIVGALVGFGGTLVLLIRDLSRQDRKDGEGGP